MGREGSYCERAYLESCLLEGMGREGELLREGVLCIERVVYWKVWGGRGVIARGRIESVYTGKRNILERGIFPIFSSLPCVFTSNNLGRKSL